MWVVGLRDSGVSWFGASVDPQGRCFGPLHQGRCLLRRVLPRSAVSVTVQQRDALRVQYADLTMEVKASRSPTFSVCMVGVFFLFFFGGVGCLVKPSVSQP